MELPRHLVTLEIDGQGFTVWQSVSIDLSLESAARSFTVQAFQQSPGQVVARPGSLATLRLNGAVLVTGWVDDIDVERDAGGSAVAFMGRSRTADLVDSAPAPATLRTWTHATPLAIITELAAPFGISVTTDAAAASTPFRRFAREHQETAWDVVDRICSARGLLAIDTATGALHLTRIDAATAPRHLGVLQGGGNVLSWRVSHKGSQRFSSYVARGQTVGDVTTPAALASSVIGTAADVGVTRPRYFAVDAHGLDTAGAVAKAQWEATTRYGRAITVSCTLPGWTDAAGTIWTPGYMVHVRIPHAGLDTELVVVDVSLTKDAQGGTRSTLTLQPAEAFATFTPAPRARRGSRGYEAGAIDVKKAVATAEAYK